MEYIGTFISTTLAIFFFFVEFPLTGIVEWVRSGSTYWVFLEFLEAFFLSGEKEVHAKGRAEVD